MGERFGGNVAMAKEPMSESEDAAISWAKARERLFSARNTAENAALQHAEAEKAEQEAWSRLQMVAGRAPAPCTPSSPRVY